MSQGKKSFFSAEARSSGDLRGKQRVDQAAQLIGLMTDDALMTAACDLPLCVPGLYVTVAASDNKGNVASIGFWTNWHTDSGTLTQRCIVCFSHRAHVQRDREGVTIFFGGGECFLARLRDVSEPLIALTVCWSQISPLFFFFTCWIVPWY